MILPAVYSPARHLFPAAKYLPPQRGSGMPTGTPVLPVRLPSALALGQVSTQPLKPVVGGLLGAVTRHTQGQETPTT